MNIKKLTRDDLQRGFIVCDCGKYAYVFRASVLSRLQGDQVGETCAECGQYMVSIEKLREAGFDIPDAKNVDVRPVSLPFPFPYVEKKEGEGRS